MSFLVKCGINLDLHGSSSPLAIGAFVLHALAPCVGVRVCVCTIWLTMIVMSLSNIKLKQCDERSFC